METTFFRSLPKKLFFCFIEFLYMSAGCVSTFRTCVQGYLEWLPFVFCFLPSFHAFVIDLLSIRKVIIFSPMIATPYGHVLTSRSNGIPSKKIMESLRTFVFVETVLRRGRMFQGSDEV